MKNDLVIRVVIGVLALALLAAATVALYADDSDDLRAVRAAGYTDVRIGGWAPFACSDSDVTSKRFSARDGDGRPVAGVVCCGFLKKCTIRW